MQIGGDGYGHWNKKDKCWDDWFKDNGYTGHQNKTLNWPSGVVLDSAGNIWVADRFNNRLQKFTPEGEIIESETIDTGIFDNEHKHWKDHWDWWSALGEYKPGGIAIDQENNLYVSDQFHERVLKFNPQGEILLEIGTDQNKESKWKWNQHPWFKHRWEEEAVGGTGAGQFRNPDGIAVNEQGYIYVVDQSNNRIQKFDQYGNFVMLWGKGKEKDRWGRKEQETIGSEFDNPGGIAYDNEGIVHVVDRENHRIQVFGLPTSSTTLVVSAPSFTHSSLLTDFVLGEYYSFPNPVKYGNPPAGGPTIHFECGLADKLEIKIYDIAGELVKSEQLAGSNWQIVDGKYCYEFNWDISNVASGVYIYCIEARKSGYPEIKVRKKLAVIK